jgi:hypothetical protein
MAFLTCRGDPDDGLPFRPYPPLFTAPVNGSFWVAVALLLEPVLLILEFSTRASPSPMTMMPDKHNPLSPKLSAIRSPPTYIHLILSIPLLGLHIHQREILQLYLPLPPPTYTQLNIFTSEPCKLTCKEPDSYGQQTLHFK